MPETFYSILTATGKAKFANAQVTGVAVDITQLAVGDGNGSYYNPTESQTALVNEVWRGNIGSINVDSNNSNWIVIETIIPAEDGGFNVREAGIFDADGDMIAVGKYPDTYKPVLTAGSAKDLYIRMIIEVTNASNVTLKIDPAVTIASRKYVDESIAPISQKADQNETDIAAHLAETTSQVISVTHNVTTTGQVFTVAGFARKPKHLLIQGFVNGTPRSSLGTCAANLVQHVVETANDNNAKGTEGLSVLLYDTYANFVGVHSRVSVIRDNSIDLTYTISGTPSFSEVKLFITAFYH